MSQIKVSIIVPVYNAVSYLRTCLESIKNQTYKNIEVLIIDDGSVDGSGEICDLYKKDKRFQVFHQKNQGQSLARNLGLKYATGDYILFVDADDYIKEYLIERVLMLVSKYNNVDIVIFDHEEVTDRGIVPFIQEFNKRNIEFPVNDIKSILHLILLDHVSNLVWDKLYKRSMWENIRFPVGYYYEDMFILPSLFLNAKNVQYLHEYLYINNRVNPSSTTSYRNDCSAIHRYSKFLAYCEHERIAKLIKDSEASSWGKSHAAHEAIKSIYINYYSNKKLLPREQKIAIDYLAHLSVGSTPYTLSLKSRFLIWSAIHFPIFCKLYGFIRHRRELLKR